MQTACPIEEGGDQKNGPEHLPFFPGIYVTHDPVNGDGPKHADEGIEDHVGIIITKTENVKDGKYFNKRISLKIVPIGIFGSKKFEYSAGVRIVKEVDHIFRRILK